jgi:hypothetical protein
MKKHTRRRLGGSRSDSRNDIGSPARSKSKTKKNEKEFLEEKTSAETINDELHFHSDEKAAPKSSARAEFMEETKAESKAEIKTHNTEVPVQVFTNLPYAKESKTRKKREKKIISESATAAAASAAAEKPKKVRKSRNKKVKEDDDEGDEGDDEGETQCEVDGRLIACKKNNKRERLLWECFKKEREISDEEISESFACEPIKIRDMVDRFEREEPSLRRTIRQIGGQGNNYDYTFMRGDKPVNIELKTNKLSTKYEKLRRVPWSGYGQLIQLFLNVKAEKYKPLFDSFDIIGMMRTWYEAIIVGEVVPKYNIEGPITHESYWKMSFNSSKDCEKLFDDESIPSGARNLFKYLHEHRDEDDTMGDLWKSFTKTWMETHRFDENFLLELIKSTLNKKDIWICTTKDDAYIIPGPKCTDAPPVFKMIKNKKVSVMVYEFTLIDGTTQAEYKVDFEFRFYWKNGGQGVHNLCLQIG